MRYNTIFRALCAAMVWIYLAATVQAGEVITTETKTWAKQAINLAKTEKKLAPTTASNTIAVLYYNNKSGKKEFNALEKGLAIMLITDLAKISTIQVVERIKIQALLNEMELGGSGLVDPNTAPKVGKILGAYYLENGDINAGKVTQISIAPVLIDVPFGNPIAQPNTTGDMPDIFRMEKEILASIVEQMKIVLTPEEQQELDKPFAASTAAALAFFAGISLSDTGNYAEAFTMYEKALAADKNFTPAKDALHEIKTLGLSNTSAGTAKAAASSEEGISTTTIVLTALGVAAVAGGIALAVGGSGGSSSNNNSSGVLTPTTPPLNGSFTCSTVRTGSGSFSGAYFNYSSSLTLTSDSCSATILPSTWSATAKNTGSSVTVTAFSPSACTSGAQVAITISNCLDTKRNSITSQTFSYTAN